MSGKTVWSILLVCACLTACASQEPVLIGSLLGGGIPLFTQPVEPILDPIQPCYKPTAVHFTYAMAMYAQVGAGASPREAVRYFEMTGENHIAQLGDLLTWNMRVKKMVSAGETIAPGPDLIEARILMDRFGTILDIEIASPATDAAGARHRQAAALIASTKAALEKFGAFLPQHPIRSGDAIVKIDRGTFGDLLAGFTADVKLNKDLEYITQGWSRFQGKKVLVAAIDESLTVALARDADLRVKVDGFYLFDAETFQIVDGDVLWVIAPQHPGGGQYHSKIRIHQSAKAIDPSR